MKLVPNNIPKLVPHNSVDPDVIRKLYAPNYKHIDIKHKIAALYAPTPPQGSKVKPKSKTDKKKNNKRRVKRAVIKKKSKKKVKVTKRNVGAQLSSSHHPVNIKDLFK